MSRYLDLDLPINFNFVQEKSLDDKDTICMLIDLIKLIR